MGNTATREDDIEGSGEDGAPVRRRGSGASVGEGYKYGDIPTNLSFNLMQYIEGVCYLLVYNINTPAVLDIPNTGSLQT